MSAGIIFETKPFMCLSMDFKVCVVFEKNWWAILASIFQNLIKLNL